MTFRADTPVRTELFDQPSSALALPPDLVAGLYDKFRELPTQVGNEVDVASLGFGTNPLWFDSATDESPGLKQSEILVANLPPNDLGVDSLPPYEQPSERPSEQQPELELMEVLKNFPNNPTNEDYARAVPEVERILIDQARITDGAQNDFLNYEGIDDLLVQSDAQYQAVIDSLPPKLLTDQGYADRLRNLHVLVFSGHEGEAGLTLEELKGAAGGQSDTELQNYFDQLRKIARDNPEIVNEYGQLGNQYFYEWNTEQDMLKLLNEHTLGDFFFQMR